MAASSSNFRRNKYPRGNQQSTNKAVQMLKRSLNNAYGIPNWEDDCCETSSKESVKLKLPRSVFSQLKKVFKSEDQFLGNFDTLFNIFDFTQEEIFDLFKSVNTKNPNGYIYMRACSHLISKQEYLDEYLDVLLSYETLESDFVMRDRLDSSPDEEKKVNKDFHFSSERYSETANSIISQFEPEYYKYEKFLPIFEKVSERMQRHIDSQIDLMAKELYKDEFTDRDKMKIERKKYFFKQKFLSRLIHNLLCDNRLRSNISVDFIEKYGHGIPLTVLYDLYKINGMNVLMNDLLVSHIKNRMERRIKETFGSAAEMMTIKIEWDDTTVQLFENAREDDEKMWDFNLDEGDDFFFWNIQKSL